MNRTEANQAAMDQLGKIINNGLTDFGEKYIARPWNDMVRGMMQGNGKDWGKAGVMMWNPAIGYMMNGGFNSNSGENAVTPKAPH
jgi:predicted oxidoreductase